MKKMKPPLRIRRSFDRHEHYCSLSSLRCRLKEFLTWSMLCVAFILAMKHANPFEGRSTSTDEGNSVSPLPPSDSVMAGISFDKSLVLEPEYLPSIIDKETEPIEELKCALGGRYPFLMHAGLVGWLCNNGGEKKVTQVMGYVFQKHCMGVDQDNPDNLMLDIGSNHGYYGLLSMKMGCRALLFDLQPGCQRYINNALVVNQFSTVGRVVPFGVSHTESSFAVPLGTCGGRFPAQAHEQGRFDQGDGTAYIKPLTSFIGPKQKVVMVKIDTEGNERNVLEGAIDPYFSQRLIRNVVVEITPGANFWKHNGLTREDVAETFRKVASYGYSMVSLHDWSVHLSPDQVHSYVMKANFTQSDMWLTRDEVTDQVLNDVKKQ